MLFKRLNEESEKDPEIRREEEWMSGNDSKLTPELLEKNLLIHKQIIKEALEKVRKYKEEHGKNEKA
ncbi:MAG: hypothetical protein AAB482_01660 [Patescibacteria group bacterium]